MGSLKAQSNGWIALARRGGATYEFPLADETAARQPRLVVSEQYFLHFNSMSAANELMDLSVRWGHNVLRMFTVSARDHHLRQKYKEQLSIRRDPLSRLSADQVIAELAVTGSDFFIAEDTDLTLLFRLKKPGVVF